MNNRPLMFEPERILYEDNHLIVVNKRSGELVQPDPTGDPALEDEVKEMIRVRDGKPGAVWASYTGSTARSAERSCSPKRARRSRA